MMAHPPNERTQMRGHPGAETSKTNNRTSQNTAVRAGAQQNKIIPDDGKRAAMLRYDFGLCGFVDTQIAFVAHPDWRRA